MISIVLICFMCLILTINGDCDVNSNPCHVNAGNCNVNCCCGWQPDETWPRPTCMSDTNKCGCDINGPHGGCGGSWLCNADRVCVDCSADCHQLGCENYCADDYPIQPAFCISGETRCRFCRDDNDCPCSQCNAQNFCDLKCDRDTPATPICNTADVICECTPTSCEIGNASLTVCTDGECFPDGQRCGDIGKRNEIFVELFYSNGETDAGWSYDIDGNKVWFDHERNDCPRYPYDPCISTRGGSSDSGFIIRDQSIIDMKKVRILYDVNAASAGGGTCSIEYFDNGSSTWKVIVEHDASDGTMVDNIISLSPSAYGSSAIKIRFQSKDVGRRSGCFWDEISICAQEK